MSSHLVPLVNLKECSKLNTFKSLFAILLNWFLIGLFIWISEYFQNLIVTIFIIICIATRIHALGILLHDCLHSRIVKNKFLNDWIGRLLLAWPIFFSLSSFREDHLKHHKYLRTENDPEWTSKQNSTWVFPKKKWELILLLIKDLLGINFYSTLKEDFLPKFSKKNNKNNEYTFIRIPYYLVCFGLIFYFGWGMKFFVYWILPMVTFAQLGVRIRKIGEHFALEAENKFNNTRTTYTSPFASFFLVPCNINYHIDHHLYPSVPFYNLPKLHKLLLQNTEYKTNAHISKSYFHLLKECLGG